MLTIVTLFCDALENMFQRAELIKELCRQLVAVRVVQRPTWNRAKKYKEYKKAAADHLAYQRGAVGHICVALVLEIEEAICEVLMHVSELALEIFTWC